MFGFVAEYKVKNVKGGVKLDHQGGAKPDHFGIVEGFGLLDLQGGLERRPAPPLGGAFRPERKAPLQIAASCGVGEKRNYIRRAGFAGRFRLLSLSR